MKACTCWVRVSLHDGHCCFRDESPDDCHDASGREARHMAGSCNPDTCPVCIAHEIADMPIDEEGAA